VKTVVFAPMAQHRHRGQPRVAKQPPHGKAEIAHHQLQPPRRLGFAALFAGNFAAAEGDGGLPPRFFGAHPSGKIRFHPPLDMGPEFFVHILAPLAGKEETHPCQPLVQHWNLPHDPTTTPSGHRALVPGR